MAILTAVLATLASSSLGWQQIQPTRPASIGMVIDHSREQDSPLAVPASDRVQVQLDDQELYTTASAKLGERLLPKDGWLESSGRIDELLRQYRSIALVTQGGDEEPRDVKLLLKSVTTDNKVAALQTLQFAFQSSPSKSLALVVRKPPDKGGITVKALSKPEEIEQEWSALTGENTCRYAAFTGAAFISIVPRNADEQRKALIESFGTNSEKAFRLAGEGNEPSKRAQALAAVSQITDGMFKRMRTECLLNNRFEMYDAKWNHDLSIQIKADRTDAKVWADAQRFAQNLAKANDPFMCTATVSASRGEGAVISRCKAVDARVGSYIEMGRTVAVEDIERAEYVFRSERNGKITGTSGVIDCTVEQKVIEIRESP